jgi:DNA primase
VIPPKQIQEVIDAVRIEEVVGEFVTLRRRGANMTGLCPFHNEKTPSFNVNPVRNIFKCFGCGKAGDSITFLRELENFTYVDAIRWLAKKYNVQIEEIERTPEQLAEIQAADSLYIVNDFALKHFETQLFDTDEGQQVALTYFKQRGLREHTIRAFGLGYAPDQRDLLLRRAKVENHSLDLLKKTGLCSQDGTRDFFRGRVMFAIHNLSGKVAAFAGRTFSADKTVPKYINSPETEIYIKNRTLYGAFQAKKAIRQRDECILVEGYMDVISLHQAGIENAVASSGTSLTEGQVQLIRRNTENLKILYDGDPAGIKAAIRGLDIALEQDMNVKIVLLPEGEDPDSYVQKHGGDALTQYANDHAQDFILFKTELLLSDIKGDPMKKAALIKDIVSSIAKIPDPIKRSVYLKECASLLNVDENALSSEINKLISTAIKKKSEKAARQPGAASDSPPAAASGSHDGWPDAEWPSAPPDEIPPFYDDMPHAPAAATRPNVPPASSRTKDEFQEKDLVRLLVEHGHQLIEKENMTVAEFVLSDIEDSVGSFENTLYGTIVQESYNILLRGEKLEKDYFLHHENAEITAAAVDLVTSPFEMSENWITRHNLPLQNQKEPALNFEEDARQALTRFKLHKLEKMCTLNAARVKTAAQSGDMEEMMRFMKIQQKLNESRNALAEKFGIVVLPK